MQDASDRAKQRSANHRSCIKRFLVAIQQQLPLVLFAANSEEPGTGRVQLHYQAPVMSPTQQIGQVG